MLGKTSWYSIDASGNDRHILLFYKKCHICHLLPFAKVGQITPQNYGNVQELMASCQHRSHLKSSPLSLVNLRVGKPKDRTTFPGAPSALWQNSIYSSCLFNISIPKILRKATVIALPIPNPTDNPKNYRPISLLCTPFKLLARLDPIIDPPTIQWTGRFPPRMQHRPSDRKTDERHRSQLWKKATMQV